MPYDLIYSSYGNNNNKQQDNSLLGKLKNDIKNLQEEICWYMERMLLENY